MAASYGAELVRRRRQSDHPGGVALAESDQAQAFHQIGNVHRIVELLRDRDGPQIVIASSPEILHLETDLAETVHDHARAVRIALSREYRHRLLEFDPGGFMVATAGSDEGQVVAGPRNPNAVIELLRGGDCLYVVALRRLQVALDGAENPEDVQCPADQHGEP